MDCLALNTATSLTGAHGLFYPTTPGSLSRDLADLLEWMDLPEGTTRPQVSAALAEDITYTCLHAREQQLAQLSIVLTAAGVLTAAVIGGALMTQRSITARVKRD